MKRIEFIAPVEAMRGNLSRTKQGLLYADNDNPAWDAPEGKRSYARNYQPIFVGAKVSKSGRKYFSVKTKTAITISPAVKKRMALLAIGSELANKIMATYQMQLPMQRLYMANHPTGWSYKRWVMYYVRQGLDQKRPITFPGYEELPALFVKNPFINTTQPSTAMDTDAPLSDELLAKFWKQLANDPITFKVGDLTGIAHSNDTFQIVIDSNYNVLGMTTATTGGDVNVKIDDQYVQVLDVDDPEGEWEYTVAGDEVIEVNSGYEYRLTNTAPGA